MTRGLHDGHQRHVRVGHDDDGAEVVGLEHVGDDDGGGAVRRADDADGGGVLDLKAHERRHAEGEEDAELRRRAEDHHLGVGEQRREVDHGADADKQQKREELVGNTGVEQHIDGADLLHAVNELGDGAGHRQVDQDRAEAHGQQQRGFHLFLDRQPDQQPADGPHDHLLPLQVEDVAEKFLNHNIMILL